MFDGLLKTLRYLFTKDDTTFYLDADFAHSAGMRDMGADLQRCESGDPVKQNARLQAHLRNRSR